MVVVESQKSKVVVMVESQKSKVVIMVGERESCRDERESFSMFLFNKVCFSLLLTHGKTNTLNSVCLLF